MVNLSNIKVGDTIFLYDLYASKEDRKMSEKVLHKWRVIKTQNAIIQMDGRAKIGNHYGEAYHNETEFIEKSSHSIERQFMLNEVNTKLNELTLSELKELYQYAINKLTKQSIKAKEE